MDPSLQMWPMNVDVGPLDPVIQQHNVPQQQQQAGQGAQQGPPTSSPGGVFMGASTPGMM